MTTPPQTPSDPRPTPSRGGLPLRLITDSALCRDCQACTLACSLYHEGECNPSLARLQVAKDMAAYRFAIVSCQYPTFPHHTGSSQEDRSARPGAVGTGGCETAECVAACPNGALRFNEAGFPVLYRDECLLCGECAAACPFQAIFYHARTDRYLKCDLCQGRADGPLCARVCPVGAITVLSPFQPAR